MYPTHELDEIAHAKRTLIARAAVARDECVAAGGTVIQPVYWIDTAFAAWSRVSPFVEVGALAFSRNRFGRRLGVLGLAMKWGPTLWRVARVVRSQRNGASAPEA